MSLRPQVRVGIINDMFSHQGKKTDDLFELKEIRDAISALERNNPVQGAAARADYLSYTNQPDQALIAINRAIKKYGNNDFFIVTKAYASEYVGIWNIIKKTYEDILMHEKTDHMDEHLQRYIELCDLYIDNSGNFENIMQSYKVEGYQQFSSNIDILRQSLHEQDITLSTYRKTVKITFNTIFEKYNLPLKLRFNTPNLQFVISSSLWSDKDALDMTKAINDAIMEDSDLDFQVEADDIEIFCTNFPLEQVPEDFSYYGEDLELDNEFEKLIQSRMDVNTSPEVDGEILHV